jgi:hypothetical protein
MKILFYLLILISTAAISAAAQASASTGGDQTICAGQSTAGLGGTVGNGATTGVWTSSGTGTFAPDDTTLNATYAPSAADASAGTVTLTLTTTDQAEGVEPGTAQVVVTIPLMLQAPVAWNSDPTNMTGTGVYLCWDAVPGADGYCIDVFDITLWPTWPTIPELFNYDAGNATNAFWFDAVQWTIWYFRVRAYTTNTCDTKRHYGPTSNLAIAANFSDRDPVSVSATEIEAVTITWDDFDAADQQDSLSNFFATVNLATVTRISLADQGITSISFATNFPALQSLDLSGNLLTNVYCMGAPSGNIFGPLTNLNVSNNPYLLHLDCAWNNLTYLDVTDDTNLLFLNAFANAELATVDISTCPSLWFVDLGAGNNITSFNTANNPQLASLCLGGSALGSLDVTANPELLSLFVSGAFEDVDLSGNPKLQGLGLGSTNLTNLTISSTELQTLDLSQCPANVMTNVDLHSMPNLMGLAVPQATPNLDISGNPLLFFLKCSGSSLPSLVASNYPWLEYLECAGCGIADLDIRNNTNLKCLACSSNSLTSLDVSNNPLLDNLACSGNSLTSLDVSSNPLLEKLECRGCGLTNLSVSGNTILRYLDCYNNSLQCSSIGNILSNLVYFGQGSGYLDLSGGSNCPPANGDQNYYVMHLRHELLPWTVKINLP